MTADPGYTARPAIGPNQLLLARLATGLLMGLALYMVTNASRGMQLAGPEQAAWIALTAMVIAVPLVLLGGLGHLRGRPLVIWLIAAAVAAALIGFHDGSRRGTLVPSQPFLTPPTLLALIAGLFLVHTLVAGGCGAGNWRAPYRHYFYRASNQTVQLVLSVAFVGAMWAALLLGSSLFEVIGVREVRTVVTERAFSLIVTGGAFAGAIHFTDGRAATVQGLRTLGLQLLSFLLPLAALIAAGFLVTLCFTGLELLWATQNATRALLGSVAGLLVLVNAAYQDGAPERAWPAWLRWSGRLAALLLVPLTVLAAYGLGLRVSQHGWTTARVIAAAIAVVLGYFSATYALAALRRGPWLAGIEGANFWGAWLVPATLLALVTPIADPTRLAVASQVARLEAGAISPDRFDFHYMWMRGGRYGEQALRRLSADATDPVIRERATIALQQPAPVRAPTQQGAFPNTPLPPERFIVHPEGRTLPEDFLRRQWAGPLGPRPNCIWDEAQLCDVVIVDLDGAGGEELIVLGREPRRLPPTAMVLRHTEHGWQMIGTLPILSTCPGLRDKLLAGDFRTVVRPYPDLEIGGINVPLDPNRQGCPRGMGLID